MDRPAETSSCMNTVRDHYQAALGKEGLLARLKAKLAELGDDADVERQLAAFDHFHVRGEAATAELAVLAGVAAGMRVLDAGCGLGGPSRTLATTWGCDVVGVDLSPAFLEVASWLAARAGISCGLRYEVADLAALPFPDEGFDLVWSEHVMMNVAERKEAYREIARVLKPGGRFAFYEPVAVDGAPRPHYPTPWANAETESHVLTQDQTASALCESGLALVEWRDVGAAAIAAFASQPPPNPKALGIGLAMGPRFPQMAMNFARNIGEGRVGLAMGIAQRL